MHIPDNYLSPETCAVMTAAMVPVWVHCVRKVKKDVPKEKMPMLGVGAAFSFTGMMFNIPLPGGTTGHAVGGTLISILLGPEAACISITIALLVQALLFGDGGILAVFAAVRAFERLARGGDEFLRFLGGQPVAEGIPGGVPGDRNVRGQGDPVRILFFKPFAHSAHSPFLL